MHIYISVDIEGITGLVSWSQCSRPDGNSFDYAFARRRMTGDVIAAIEGARAAGATEITIKDSHGNSKNLLLDDLPGGVRLITGQAGAIDGMMAEVGSRTPEPYAAAVLIGYHAMAGTPDAVMEHTITGSLHRLHLNGKETGEIGLSAYTAGQAGVPLVAISSDAAGCAEAANLVPGIATAVVKTGLGRYMADCLHPAETAPMIAAAVEDGIRRRNEIGLTQLSGPVTAKMEFNRAEETEIMLRLPFFERFDGYSVVTAGNDFDTVHRLIWTGINLSFQGIKSQF
jgi:D-amino peptidase